MTSFLHSAFYFLIILGVLVFVHELGHYWAAKRAGMRVLAFAIGIGPAVPGLSITDRDLRRIMARLGLRRSAEDSDDPGTRYSICMVPLGGFVRIAGMEPSEDPNVPGGFNTRPWGWRFVTLIAGCMMNFALAAVLFCVIGAFIGVPVSQGSTVEMVVVGTPAQKAGIRPGDRMVEVAGHRANDSLELRKLIESHPNQPTVIGIERDGQLRHVTVVPMAEPDEMGHKIGRIGIRFAYVHQRIPIPLALVHGLEETWLQTTEMLHNLEMMVLGRVPGRAIHGPVAIFQMTGKEADQGLPSLLGFAAMLSVNLGLMNLLPIPALDGGRLLFLLVEALRGGRRLDPTKEAYVHVAGFVFLLLLMVVITYHDLFDRIR